jgi:hypothetical protein
MKSMIFQKLVKKVEDCEKAFGKKPSPSIGEIFYLAQKDKSKPPHSSIGERNKRGRGCGRKSFRFKG